MRCGQDLLKQGGDLLIECAPYQGATETSVHALTAWWHPEPSPFSKWGKLQEGSEALRGAGVFLAFLPKESILGR